MNKFYGDNCRSKTRGRRDFIKTLGIGAAGFTGFLGAFDFARAAITPGEKGIYITGISVATIRGLNSTSRIVRLDTNKGISGYGECRVEDYNSGTELNKCKPIILGMNPTQVDKVYNAVTAALNPTSDWTRITYASGAIAGIENACWDITGKVYNVPVWKLLGPKIRDSMRMYCDTPAQRTISALQKEVESRIEMGFTWFKMDVDGILDRDDYQTSPEPNPYTDSRGSAKRILVTGYTKWMDYASEFRKLIGKAPLSADHFFAWSPSGGGSQLDVDSAIKLSNYMAEPAYMDKSLGGWMEDIIPWHYYDELAQIRAGTEMNILTGEDMFSLHLVQELINANAIDYFHPDPATFGGIHSTRLAAMWAHEKGVKTAFHQSNGPFAMIANTHICAGIPDFLSCEHHYPDVSWYDSLIDGIPKPMMQNGYIPIPDGPGLGITPNESAMRAHGTWFAPI